MIVVVITVVVVVVVLVLVMVVVVIGMVVVVVVVVLVVVGDGACTRLSPGMCLDPSPMILLLPRSQLGAAVVCVDIADIWSISSSTSHSKESVSLLRQCHG